MNFVACGFAAQLLLARWLLYRGTVPGPEQRRREDWPCSGPAHKRQHKRLNGIGTATNTVWNRERFRSEKRRSERREGADSKFAVDKGELGSQSGLVASQLASFCALRQNATHVAKRYRQNRTVASLARRWTDPGKIFFEFFRGVFSTFLATA